MNEELLTIELKEEEIDGIIDRLFDKSEVLHGDLPARADINQFYGLVQHAVEREKALSGKKLIEFTQDYSGLEDNISGARITFKLFSRKPGVWQQAKTGMASRDTIRRARHSILRKISKDPERPGLSIFTHGSVFDNVVQFTIYAVSNEAADETAVWFEDLMEDWRWLWQGCGIQRVEYLERLEDMTLISDQKKVAVRRLQYFIRTERLKETQEFSLRTLMAELSLINRDTSVTQEK